MTFVLAFIFTFELLPAEVKLFIKFSRIKEAALITSVILSCWPPSHCAFAKVRNYAEKSRCPRVPQVSSKGTQKIWVKGHNLYKKYPFVSCLSIQGVLAVLVSQKKEE